MLFKKLEEWLTELFPKKEGDGGIWKNKSKKLNFLIVIGAFGVLLIILANNFSTETEKPQVKITSESGPGSGGEFSNSPQASVRGAGVIGIEDLMGQRLEGVLSQITGVGQVKATVNLASTVEFEYAINTSTISKQTDENDQKGGNRTVTEINEDGKLVLIREGEGNRETPVVKKEIKPEVQGVVVVADGAEDPEIKAQLVEATRVFLNVSPHRVVVLPKESR